MDHITFLVAVVIVTLAFDFTNGFHDTANAMATSIATGALKPRTAVLIGGVLNIVGAFLSTEVAKTISGGIVDDTLVTPGMIFAGLIGAVWVSAGADGVHFTKVVEKVLIPAPASPLVAGIAALIATYLAYKITARARRDSVTKGFRAGQIASASLVSLAHGTNDAQKTMGIITLTLISAGALGHDAGPPAWVIASAGLAIGLGTYLGGRRIIRTMGRGLAEIQSPQGFAAETASTAVILTSAHLGFALSTTQVASGSILGAGPGRRPAEVHWGVAGRMVMAWLITLPAAALVGGVSAGAVRYGGNFGTVVVALVAVAVAAGIVLAARRNPVGAHNVNDTHEVSIKSTAPTSVGTAA
ncbi:inorganic phosphate transporter [Streptomyces sp. NPDC047042]|uniref:inorganic phosphate transporter n=1 Tax=Streptomyces sp. NPDC047042 TaxID=3154807 RepID=UPI0033D5599F